ncbi:hypothetical protein D9757_009962 [Collybiopsis confluens]|uniref:C3H1-type domain-containing protein n=1 Tax=Collybiopsis confluens TaxID=2823264 RepID=A0A8H5H2H6_9AGAR|nr:hypothetical protein D9757_009962 [Collybiopsis confluens]
MQEDPPVLLNRLSATRYRGNNLTLQNPHFADPVWHSPKNSRAGISQRHLPYSKFEPSLQRRISLTTTPNPQVSSSMSTFSTPFTLNLSSSNKREKLPDESDDDDEPHSSRPKIDITALPWSSRTSSVQLSPELEKTRVILENFSRNPKLVKASILSQPDCPPFSSEDWENLIAGKPTNLTTSSRVSTLLRSNEKRKSLATSSLNLAPKPRVKPYLAMATGSSLGTAILIIAAIFAFPHRISELNAYRTHISQLFSCTPSSSHSRVINYDKAACLRVSQTRRYLLSSFGNFNNLNIRWIQAPSWGGNNRFSSTSGVGKSRRDTCHRWNKKRCPNTASACRYAHVCGKCRSNGHVKSNCKKSESNKD